MLNAVGVPSVVSMLERGYEGFAVGIS